MSERKKRAKEKNKKKKNVKESAKEWQFYQKKKKQKERASKEKGRAKERKLKREWKKEQEKETWKKKETIAFINHLRCRVCVITAPPPAVTWPTGAPQHTIRLTLSSSYIAPSRQGFTKAQGLRRSWTHTAPSVCTWWNRSRDDDEGDLYRINPLHPRASSRLLHVYINNLCTHTWERQDSWRSERLHGHSRWW